MAGWARYSCLMLLTLLWCGGESKVVRKLVNFRPGWTWQYLTKFGISIGQGYFEAKARFVEKYIPPGGRASDEDILYDVALNIYLDTKWPSALEESECAKKAEHEIRMEHIMLRGDGTWSELKSGYLRQRTRPYVWFVAASDCGETLHSRHPTMPSIELYIRFRGYDGGEFSHEEIGLFLTYSLALVVYILLLGYNVYSYLKDYKQHERVLSPTMFVLIAVVLELLSLACQWVHLLVYSYDGEGLGVCDIFSVICEVASEFMLSLLLIMLSWGWSITYLEFTDSEMLAPLVVALLLVHLILAALTQISNDAYHKYHDYEGIQGLLLAIGRLGMFAYFLYGMRDTYLKARAKLRSFIKTFAIYSSVYLLVFPALVLLCLACAPYVRHKVIVIGIISAQTAALCLLLRLFSAKSSYTEVAKYGDTILPGGKNDPFFSRVFLHSFGLCLISATLRLPYG